mmetsp:Transcript_4285/g.10889  ORF Transcript_4285/g.10889 Transcript_4285/m.10889 type:complete len:317 (-) Transcript_4285:156-1106(-)
MMMHMHTIYSPLSPKKGKQIGITWVVTGKGARHGSPYSHSTNRSSSDLSVSNAGNRFTRQRKGMTSRSPQFGSSLDLFRQPPLSPFVVSTLALAGEKCIPCQEQDRTSLPAFQRLNQPDLTPSSRKEYKLPCMAYEQRAGVKRCTAARTIVARAIKLCDRERRDPGPTCPEEKRRLGRRGKERGQTGAAAVVSGCPRGAQAAYIMARVGSLRRDGSRMAQLVPHCVTLKHSPSTVLFVVGKRGGAGAIHRPSFAKATQSVRQVSADATARRGRRTRPGLCILGAPSRPCARLLASDSLEIPSVLVFCLLLLTSPRV